jgi:hypothetical protein
VNFAENPAALCSFFQTLLLRVTGLDVHFFVYSKHFWNKFIVKETLSMKKTSNLHGHIYATIKPAFFSLPPYNASSCIHNVSEGVKHDIFVHTHKTEISLIILFIKKIIRIMRTCQTKKKLQRPQQNLPIHEQM